MSGMTEFESADFSVAIDEAWTNVTDTINNFYTGKTLDFELTQGSDQLEKLADHTQWGACGTNEPHFAVESWVPSTEAGAAIGCVVSSGNKLSTCADIGNSATCTPACFDSQSILQEVIDASATITAKLDARYADASCGTFNDALELVYDNYYAKKTAAAGYGDLLTRFAGMDDPGE